MGFFDNLRARFNGPVVPTINAPALASAKVKIATSLTPLQIFQAKVGAEADGVFGKDTFNKAKTFLKLTDRQAVHFFAQTNVESDGFSVFTENLNYSAVRLVEVFPKYFPNLKSTEGYARNPEKIANRVYASRMGNGDEKTGDGWFFRGRGALQLTGKANYSGMARYYNADVILTKPDVVAIDYAFQSALYYFYENNVWALCDKGLDNATVTLVTKRVNGGTNGLTQRLVKTKEYSAWI